MNNKAEYYIKKLGLEKHPEGGYFKETYRADESIEKQNLPSRYNGQRVFATSIYFLLESSKVSFFHKLKSDEIWHFYDGSPVKLYIIKNENEITEIVLGKNLENGEVIQAVIEKNHWFGAEVINEDSFSLVGCTVSPGFDFGDFELGKREELLKKNPNNSDIIQKFTPF